MQFKFVFKLVLVLALIGILPLLLNSFLSFSIIKDSLEKLTFSNLERMNELVSFEIENIMAQAFDNIAVLARNPILISKEKSKEEKAAELEKISKYYPLFKDITILNKNGEVIISTTYLFYGGWSTNFWFSEAKRKKEIVASDMYAILDPQKPILAFFAPILDEKGEVDTFIAAQLDTKFLWQILDFKIGEKGYPILINSLGDIIFHPQRNLLFDKIPSEYHLKENSLLKKGITKFKFQNENFIASFNVLENYRSYPGHNWHLILVQPETEALALINTLSKQIYIFLTFSFFSILLVSFFLGRYITQPLKKLSLGAKEVAAGNLETKVEIKTKDEFEELATTFNEMIRELKNYQASLEESKSVLEVKVAARTRELRELAESLEEKVKERTKELQGKVEELERFHKLAVGRELKMVELKKEIENLKKELQKYERKEK
jgi:HAMP domain-containing protein